MSGDRLAYVVGDLMASAGLSIGLAESCTGGLICSRLTDVPGSSRYFVGGIVVYSYSAKEHLLQVSHETLVRHGAVSKETAIEMARGVRRLFHTDIGLGVTGIAGPGGGLPGKPVGLVYIALVTQDSERCERHIWQGERTENKSQSADAAMRLIRAYLEDIEDDTSRSAHVS